MGGGWAGRGCDGRRMGEREGGGKGDGEGGARGYAGSHRCRGAQGLCRGIGWGGSGGFGVSWGEGRRVRRG